MAEGRAARRLAAILAADVAGWSRLMGADEERTLAALKEIRLEIGDPEIKKHRGRIVKTTGDRLLVEFGSVVDAVDCAAAVQQAMAERNAAVPEERRIEFRIGINLGDVIRDKGDIFGDGVNIAARLEAMAEPGGICVSAVVHDQVRGRVHCAFDDLGEQSLKNIARPIRVYRVKPLTPTLSPQAGRGREDARPLGGVPSPHAWGEGQGEGRQPALPLPDKPSIAVLPFQNMSGDPEQEYFADGMVEEIITALSRIRWLFVIARNSSFTYKGRAVDVKQVARELGVRYVLEGSVRRGGDRVRITAQLIDALSGAHLWAERYDRDFSDIFAVQDEIASTVAGVIEPALAEAEQQRALRKRPEILDAWEAYQRGLWHLYKYEAAENRISQAFFRQAIALDPNFPPGHQGLALALWFHIWLYRDPSVTAALDVAVQEARIAASLDGKDAVGHALLAQTIPALGEWEAAVAEARIALEINPNSAFVMGAAAIALCAGGHSREAIDYLRQAIRASPYDPLVWLHTHFVAASHFQLGEFEAAIKHDREVIRLRPQHAIAHLRIAASLAYLGRMGEARQAYDHAAREFPDTRWREPERGRRGGARTTIRN
jgi:adenylate cyclase